jgi:uncharacterized SAM-binding protein YcdF (DUF218 family)
MRHFLAALLVVVVLPLIALGSGFLYFTQSIVTERDGPTKTADGIVVPTGGALRIDDAMELLAGSKARRLLISGVNANTTREEVRDLVPKHAGLFDCCVDLGRDARNTIGNAAETAAWADRNRFRSLIVVTSAYHMPRALAELRHALDEIDVVPHPVILESLHLERWWTSASTTRLLVLEYFKYLAALARIHIIVPYMPSLVGAPASGLADG